MTNACVGNSAREILFIDRESVRARAVQADPSAVLSQQKLVEAAGVNPDCQIHIWLGATPSNPTLARYIAESRAQIHVVRRADKGAVEVDMAMVLNELAGVETATFISGSGALSPLIRRLQDVGIRCRVVAFSDTISGDLISLGVETIFLDAANITVEK